MNKTRKFQKLRLSLLFAGIVFLIMFVTVLLVLAGAAVMDYFHLLSHDMSGWLPLFYFAVVSLIVGTILSFIFSNKPLKPIRQIMDAADRIADGDFSIRLDLKRPDEFHQLSDHFNHMVEELGSVEMLRSDFISNFSHEFKTPIVSIRGFAKALKWENLSEEERLEYLDIIISESERLSSLSSNVLYLSRLENQMILADKQTLNVTEQIRLVIALLDKKASEKDLNIVFDCREYEICGNSEMLRQVWINLLDNAIKYSPEGGTIEISIKKDPESLQVSISNEGEAIDSAALSHIFEKFYQADRSHATAGSGLGLAIVKHILLLHGGTISAASVPGTTSFFISLPQIGSN